MRLEKLLRQSLHPRLFGIPDPTNCNHPQARRTRLAILFSGGLDCSILARLTHDILPLTESIDLLNVAFENPRVHQNHANDGSPYECCPDRITGRASYAELQRVCPQRDWNFVAIDIPYSETLKHRPNVIKLMHPHNTEMDLSISFALYFAARGDGYVSTPASKTKYTTSARVLLSGLGADELFAGYQRHATAFNRNGFAGLLDELDLDIRRLGKRNLGRDDRVISHWGREARFPYLDERLLTWVLAEPISHKCGFGVPNPNISDCSDESMQLEPGKRALRCLAWKLGMREVAKEKKRAVSDGQNHFKGGRGASLMISLSRSSLVPEQRRWRLGKRKAPSYSPDRRIVAFPNMGLMQLRISVGSYLLSFINILQRL